MRKKSDIASVSRSNRSVRRMRSRETEEQRNARRECQRLRQRRLRLSAYAWTQAQSQSQNSILSQFASAKKIIQRGLRLPLTADRLHHVQSRAYETFAHYLHSSAPGSNPSSSKLTYYGPQTDWSLADSPHKNGHDAATPFTNIYEYNNPELQDSQDRNGVVLHSDLSCTVCHNDIIGSRYVCVQCADWDMCAACEARGEHPAHYVLRLPEPKPHATGALAAFRTGMGKQNLLQSETHEIYIKKEPVEVKEEIEIMEHNPTEDMIDRSASEVNIHEVCSGCVQTTENGINQLETYTGTDFMRDTESERDIKEIRHTEARIKTESTGNISAAGDPEQDEVKETDEQDASIEDVFSSDRSGSGVYQNKENLIESSQNIHETIVQSPPNQAAEMCEQKTDLVSYSVANKNIVITSLKNEL